MSSPPAASVSSTAASNVGLMQAVAEASSQLRRPRHRCHSSRCSSISKSRIAASPSSTSVRHHAHPQSAHGRKSRCLPRPSRRLRHLRRDVRSPRLADAQASLQTHPPAQYSTASTTIFSPSSITRRRRHCSSQKNRDTSPRRHYRRRSSCPASQIAAPLADLSAADVTLANPPQILPRYRSPLSCPSVHLNFSAYLPTGVTSTGLTGASYITSSVCALGFAAHPAASRSFRAPHGTSRTDTRSAATQSSTRSGAHPSSRSRRPYPPSSSPAPSSESLHLPAILCPPRPSRAGLFRTHNSIPS